MQTNEAFYPIEAVKSIPREVLSANERLTLILLLDYRKCASIFVSADTLAEQANLGVSTVHRALRRFQELGIIETQKVRIKSRYRYYKRLNLDAIKALANLLAGDFGNLGEPELDDDAIICAVGHPG